MDTGFNYYYGADPGEYDLVVSNSEGGLDRLRELGARRAEALFWAADPELFKPLPVEKEHDVFFYGYGDKFRREWMRELVGEPSRRLPDVDFALGGEDFQGDVGRARSLGVIPFNAFNRAISSSRVALNVTRRAHATVRASSTARPFELAMAGAAIVSNPHDGIETWFEPGRELLVVEDADGATAAYRELLGGSRRRGGARRPRARAGPRRAHVRASRASPARPDRPRRARRRSRDRGARGASARRDRARVQRGGVDRRCRRRAAGLRPGASRRGRRRRLDRPHRGDRQVCRRARCSRCRSTSASAARCRPASATRGSRGSTSRSAPTATASTTRPSSTRSCARCSPTRRTSPSGRASSAGTAIAPRGLAARGSACSRGSSRR